MQFRPCIDLRLGKVVQIVGGSLDDKNQNKTQINFETQRSSASFAEQYKKDGLYGGHVISLGPGNEGAAILALKAFPGGLQIGGGITPENARTYLAAGASHVIVTSYVFSDGQVNMDRLHKLVAKVGKSRLVLDLSCRQKEDRFFIVTDRWQKFTQVMIDEKTISNLATHCDEFLVHGVDVEGKKQGIQTSLVRRLAKVSPIPVTYAGGVHQFSDLELVKAIGQSRINLTIGSALDIFGGTIPYKDVVKWHHSQ